MEYTVTKHDTTADLELIYNPEDIENAFGKAYEKAAKKAKIDGFRPGKAPIAIVKKVLGESVTQDALNILLSNSLENIQSNLEFKTFGDPKIEIQTYDRKEKLIAKASYELAPETHLGEYKNLPLKTYNFEVLDKDIEEHLLEIQYQLAKLSIKEPEESVEERDLLRMEFIAKVPDTEDIIQNKKSHMHYMGRSSKDLDFEKNFLGMKLNESKSFDYTYPEDLSDKKLAGRKFSYDVTILEIFRVQLPELDDALANEYYEEFQTLEDLKTRLKDNLKQDGIGVLNQIYFDKLIQKVIETSNFKIPKSMIETEIDQVYHKTLHELGMGHIPIERFAEMIQKDVSEVRSTFEERALGNIKTILSVYKISELEELKVEQEELEKAFAVFRRTTDPEKLKEIDLNRVVRNLHENILIDKVFRSLFDYSSKESEDIKYEEVGEIRTR